MAAPPVPTEQELHELLYRTSTSNVRAGYITKKNHLLPERYRVMEKDIEEFEVFDSDLWLCGFPKTGTTWMSEISWLILHDFDYEGAKVPDHKRFRMLEFSMLFDVTKEIMLGGEHYEMDSIGHAKAQPHPRTIKSHLPFSLLPNQISNGTRKPKIIYTARNPMDACISFYHHCHNFEGFTGTFEEFCTLFLYDKVTYTPYARHVLSFWERRNDPNIFFTTYEEMKKDLPGVIYRVAKFLGKTISESDCKRLQEYVSFDSMKKNTAVNKEVFLKKMEVHKGISVEPFIRKGKVGGYRDQMSPEMIKQFRYWMSKRFEGTGLNLLD